MAKKSNIVKKADVGIPNLPSSVVTENDKEQLLEMLDSFKEETEVTSEYLESEEGDEFKGYYMGKTRIKAMENEGDEDGMTDAVRLLLEDGKYYISANRMLVGTLSGYPEKIPVKITNTGQEKSKAGFKYNTYSIKILGV